MNRKYKLVRRVVKGEEVLVKLYESQQPEYSPGYYSWFKGQQARKWRSSPGAAKQS